MSARTADSHALLMDRIYRTQRRFYDATRKYYLFGRDRLIADLALQPGETLAEIGCGTARNLIAIARRYPETELYGLDASAEMLRTAQAAVHRSGLSDRIGLAQGYAETLTPETFALTKPLNHIVFSYSLSMIADWRGALAAATAALAPGGLIHVVDFGDLKGLPAPAARMLRSWLAQFHVVPREALLSALEADPPSPYRRFKVLPGRYSFVVSARPDIPIFRSP